MSDTGTPAGWYPDPENPGHSRYWDGAAWAPPSVPAPTEFVPAAGYGAPVGPPPGTGSNRPMVIAAVIALVAVLGIGGFFLLRDDDSTDERPVAAGDDDGPEDGGDLEDLDEDDSDDVDVPTVPTEGIDPPVGGGAGGGGGGGVGAPSGEADPLPDFDDPSLEPLGEACQAGDMQACDSLFFQAGIDTPEEEYGETCGGRTDGTSLCILAEG